MATAVRGESVQHLVAAGLAHHRKGELAAAEQAYQAVLAREPEQADALHLLGLLLGRRDPAAGAGLIERAIAASPRVSAYHNNLGSLLFRRGELARAEQAYRRALRLDPRNADAYLNLGKLLFTAATSTKPPGTQGGTHAGFSGAGPGLSEARQCFRAVVRLAPGRAEAHLSLGRLEEQAGVWLAASASYRRATALAPRHAPAWLMLANAHKALGQWDEAEQSLRQAIALEPGYGDAFYNLGNLYRSRGKGAEAIEAYQRAIELSPAEAADACNNLGVTLSELGRRQEAVAALLKAIECRRDFVDAYFHLAREANALGNPIACGELLAKVLALSPGHVGAHIEQANLERSLGRLEEAAQTCRRLIGFDGDGAAEGWHNLGVILAELERQDESIAAFEHAIARKPDYADAFFNLGRSRAGRGEEEAAFALLRKAIALDPASAAYYQELGVLEEKRGRSEQAIACYRRSLELDRTSVAVQCNLGGALAHLGDPGGLSILDALAGELEPEHPLAPHVRHTRSAALLLHGYHEEGWKAFEWRGRTGPLKDRQRHFTEPPWQGEPLDGQTILLYAEQGFGDTLQFMRYAPLVAACGGRVILDVQPGLRRLLNGLPGTDRAISHTWDGLPEFDTHASLMSLPYLLGTRVDSIPPPVAPVLPQATGTVVSPGRKYEPRPGPLRVGLVWAGNPAYQRDRLRSTSLEQWRELANIAGIVFTSLQKGPAACQIEHGSCFRFAGDCAGTEDFADTAAIVAGLDLVIAVDSSVAHLAGSMGKPVWILLDVLRDWRWGLEGRGTPWYPTARLFRQTTPLDWQPVLQQVAAELRALAEAHTGAACAVEREGLEPS